MNKIIKVGVVGIGRIGWGTSIREIAKFEDKFKIVAACDLIEDRRQKMADQFGCAVYENIEDLINDKNVELIYLATRSNDHYKHGLMALKAGKHVLLEKPVTLSYEEAVDLYAHANKEGLPRLFVHQQRRFESAFAKVYEIVNSGKLGNVFEINTEQNGFQHRDDWQTISEFGGGQLLNWGPHIIDQSLQLLGTKSFDMQSYLHQVTAGGDCEDHLRIRFIGDNNRVVNMSISGATALKKGRYYEVYGDRGALLYADDKLTVKYIDPSIVIPEVVSNPGTPGAAFGKSGTYESAIKLEWVDEEYTVEVEDFEMRANFWPMLYDDLVNGIPFPVTQEDVLSIMRTISTVKAQNKYIMKVK